MELYPVARDWATLDTERSLPSPMTSDTEQDRVTPSELSETIRKPDVMSAVKVYPPA